MFKTSLPQAMFNTVNPVFAHDIRNLRWLPRKKALRWYGLRWLLVLYIALMVGMLIARPWDYGRGNRFVRVGGLINVNTFGTVSMVLYIAADIFFVLTSIVIINREVNSGHWELLMLTNMDRKSIIEAKYAAAQLRAWRIMMLNRAVQTGLALYTLLNLVGFTSGSINAGYFFNRNPLYWLSPMLGLIFAWFIPLWRMKAMTAASVAVSSRVRNIIFVSLAGLGAVIALQLGLNALGSLPRPILFMLVGAPQSRSAPSGTNFDFMTFMVLTNVIIYGGTLLLCWLMQRVSLRYALFAAFRPE
ncbi:MAG: hypothetical protein IT324_28640 [Anaerolineae bacterium]|nr:hypothetical protein [Anaerolineae bacterium]